MKEFFLNHKSEIIVGIVVYCITTLSSHFLNLAPDIGGTIFETVNNIIYTLAATQTHNTLLIMFVFGLMGCVIASLLKPIEKHLSLLKHIKKLEGYLKKLPKGSEEKINEIVNSNIDNKLNVSSEKYDVKKVLEEGRKIKITTIYIILFLCFVLFYVNCFFVRPATLWNQFENDITLIYPYVENEKEIYQLKSDWVSMRSASDYLEIYEYIDAVKEENNLSN